MLSASASACTARQEKNKLSEIWFRNPHNYVRELVEANSHMIAWDRGITVKKGIDPWKWGKVYFGENNPWRMLVIGPQGTVDIDNDNSMDDPAGVYPTWEYGESWTILEEMVSAPIGEDEVSCQADLPPDERPVFGQEHRVVITGLPSATLSSTKALLRNIRELQEDYPACKVHLHGSYSWSAMFGIGLASADCDPRIDAQKGKVILPSGKILVYERAVGQLQWIELLGMKYIDLKIPSKRCVYNIRSAMWAAENYEKNIRFKTRGGKTPDFHSPNPVIQTTVSHVRTTSDKAKPGDKIICNSCSLQRGCKHFRVDAVCSLSDSETSALAKLFQSRNSDKILDGLSAVVGKNADRAERALETEEMLNEVDPEVTRLLNTVFNQGAQLAKLIDPTLRAGPKVAVQINQAAQGATASRNEVLAQVIKSFEDRGIDRSKITPDMMEEELRRRFNPPQEITAEVKNADQQSVS
jgi:hypothetical protein